MTLNDIRDGPYSAQCACQMCCVSHVASSPPPLPCTCTGRGLPKTAGCGSHFFVTKYRDLFCDQGGGGGVRAGPTHPVISIPVGGAEINCQRWVLGRGKKVRAWGRRPPLKEGLGKARVAGLMLQLSDFVAEGAGRKKLEKIAPTYVPPPPCLGTTLRKNCPLVPRSNSRTTFFYHGIGFFMVLVDAGQHPGVQDNISCMLLSVSHRRTSTLNPSPLLSNPSPKQPAPDKETNKSQLNTSEPVEH